MNAKVKKIKTDREFKRLIPPLSAEEREQLEANILAEGCRDDLVLWNDTLLDGHNRLEICTKHGLPYKTTNIEFPDRNAAMLWIIDNQKGRRNIAEIDRIALERHREVIVAAMAKKAQVRKPKSVSAILPKQPPINTRRECAKASGVGERTYDAGKLILDAADKGEIEPEVVEDVRRGRAAIHRVAKDIKDKRDREARQQQKLAQLKEKAKASKKVPAAKDPAWEVRHSDCLMELPKIGTKAVRLIFADPPYNIGIDYGKGKKNDSRPEEDYLRWCQTWINLCVNTLADDGSMWVMINDEYADHFGVMLREAGLHRRAWVKWYETFGVNCSKNFNRCSRHIFYCVVNPKRFVFNLDAVSRQSDRQTKYNDKRANPNGKIWDDVWQIPRLTGTCEERLPGFPTQVPLAITRAIVNCASEPGDLVLDPFNGSGSTGVAAIEADRRYVGIELEKQFCELARLRLAGI